MKVQCSCGAKYAFDVTPEMAQNPIQLVCQECGADLSEFVNGLIRQELQAAAPEPANETQQVETARPRMRIQTGPPKAEVAPAEAAAGEWPVCLKHPHQRTTHRCVMCNKPICPDCMALFGYVCSPLCRARATANGIKVPVFAGERANIERRRGRVAGLIVAGIAVAIAGLLGWWAWYAFVGSVPHPYFSVRFPELATSGESAVCADNQLVFLHGATLARYDLKQNRQIWSREAVRKSPGETDWQFKWKLENLRLRVNGRNVWVVSPEKLTRHDWDNGEPKQEIPLTDGDMLLQPNEVQLVDTTPGNCSITHISLADGTSHTEAVKEPASSQVRRAVLAATKRARWGRAGGAPPTRPAPGGAAVPNVDQMADNAQSLSMPARIALPATIANAWEEQRLMQEINDNGTPAPPPAEPQAATDDFALIPQEDGCLQFSVRLAERRLVTINAMKDRPAKSALDGNTKVSDTDAVANEMLNDMRRENGGDKVTEDRSIYQVTLRCAQATGSNAWTGMVAGPPGLISLKTVNVLVAGSSLRVFDKANRLLWQATLTFGVPLGNYLGMTADNSFGDGPVVERNNTLFVADSGVLTAFDLATGNARWRLPSIGIAGMLFDDGGHIYVNTTTANLDKLRYSRQIDIAHKIDPVVMKVDSSTGKTLWSVKPGAFISYVSGPYIYTMDTYIGDFDENGDSKYGFDTGLEKAAHMNIKRLDPKSGAELWTYSQSRCPVDVKFNRNHMQFVFHKEVQAVKFLVY